MEPATLRRHTERALYDEESIGAVFADSFFAHVSYVDNGFPQNLPMIALFRRFGDDSPSVYLHGHPTARLIELVKQQQKNAEEGFGTDDDEIKVCITATKVDGLAVSSAPNGHAFNYRSAVVHGKCIWVTDKDRKRAVMQAVTNHIIPNRWEETNPVSSVRLALVQVIRVDISKASLKIRSGRPPIQPRNPAKDGPDRDEPVWTGIIPLYETLGEFVPSGLTPDATVSRNLEEFVQGRNERCRRKAEESSVDETYGYPINK